MKLHYFLLLAFSTLSTFFTPSTLQAQDGAFVCGTDELHRKMIQEHPEILQQEALLEKKIDEYLAAHKAGNVSRSGPIIIPIVFHIIHNGGAENISDAQILDQLRILNRDYNKQNADTANVTVPELHKLIANVGLEFRLANIDPQGNYTNGIDRVYSVQTYWGNDYSKLNNWSREKYLNVWIVNNMGGGAAGYSYYPSTVAALYNSPAMDGVIILQQYLGSIGTSSNYTSRALTHEIGHYLNLKHTWGDTNAPGVACGDDGVADTPPTKGFNFCPSNPNQAKICDKNVVENYQNFMEYSYCSCMFTEGQKERMIAALESGVAGRSTLWSYDNLVATGVLDTPAKPATVKADFVPGSRYTCLNGSIKFEDLSVNAVSYNWEFPNGNPSTSTEASPTIQFLLPGWQPVKLTVTDANGNTSTKSDDMRVFVGFDNTLYQAPYAEGFESPDVFSSPSGWASANLDENNTFFSRTNSPHGGSSSAFINNYFARADHDIDEIISPAIDLTTLQKQQMNLSFYYSWASARSNFNLGPDSLCVLASTDCGKTWITIYKKNASAVLGYNEGYWKPGTESGVWKKEEISMSGGNYDRLHKPNVRFKFQFFSSVGGNNFYIDDINIGYASTTGIDEVSAFNDVTLYPNPSAGSATLNVQLAKPGQVNVLVYDMAGKEVQNAYNGWLSDGENNIQLNTTSTLAKGFYLVRIKAGEEAIQRKLVIE